MKGKSIIAVFAGALIAVPAAQAAWAEGDVPKPPVKAGAARVTTRAPEPDKWDARRTADGSQRTFKCKPLACPDPETVSFHFFKSPTRHPDPQALEKFAKVDLPKSIRAADAAREILSNGTEKLETVSSKTATLKGYPAVVNESKLTRGKASAYVEIAIIFAGPAMIRVQSASPNRELAQKSLKDFIEVMRIEEGPALQPRQPTPAVEGAEKL
jgi:hypothetical protein